MQFRERANALFSRCIGSLRFKKRIAGGRLGRVFLRLCVFIRPPRNVFFSSYIYIFFFIPLLLRCRETNLATETMTGEKRPLPISFPRGRNCVRKAEVLTRRNIFQLLLNCVHVAKIDVNETENRVCHFL